MPILHALSDAQPSRGVASDEAQQRLAAIVESSADAIVSKDLNGVIQSWNAGAERLFGYRAEEVIGRSIVLLIPDEHKHEEPRILERIRRGERIDHYETVRQRKDGRRIIVSLTVSPVRDSSGRIVGASKIARDITEQKRAERELARRAEEQAALYEFTDGLQRTRSPEEVYRFALTAIERALDCARSSILLLDCGVMRFVAWRGLSDEYRQAVEGHSPWSPDDGEPAPIFIEDVAAAELSPELKATLKREGIAALAFIPLLANGTLVGKFMVYHADRHDFSRNEIDLALTIARQLGFSLERMRAEQARLQAESALRENEQRLQLALNSGRMGAWEWDITTGKVIWSPSLEQIHGLALKTFGGSFEDFARDIHPDDRERVLASIGRSLSEREDYSETYRMVHPDGSVRWLEAFGRLVLDDNGTRHRLAGVCMDVTERREGEAQRDLLVAELSHRVKNTLATVISIAQQSFPKDAAPAAVRSFTMRIKALAQTHGRLAEANWAGVSFETLLLDEFAPYRDAESTNFRLSGPSITLNPKFAVTLGMAIHELTTNAAKYGALSTRGGVVDVSWKVDAERRRLKVCWSESGGPQVTAPQTRGFGRLLLERALGSALGGDVTLDFAASGLCCTLVLPLDFNTEHPPRMVWT